MKSQQIGTQNTLQNGNSEGAKADRQINTSFLKFTAAKPWGKSFKIKDAEIIKSESDRPHAYDVETIGLSGMGARELLDQFASHLDSCAETQNFNLGRLVDPSQHRLLVEYLYHQAVRDDVADGLGTRTKDNTEFHDGPGLGLVDVDTDRMPKTARAYLIELGDGDMIKGVVIVLQELFPHADFLRRNSTSTGIKSKDGKLSYDSDGAHIYAIFANQREAAEIVKAVQRIMWVKEPVPLAWFKPDARGQTLERSIVDTAVMKSPEREVFEAPPQLGVGLTRKPPEIVKHFPRPEAGHDGMIRLSDLASLIPPDRKVNQAREKGRAAIAAECDRIKTERLGREEGKLVEGGMSRAAARAAARAFVEHHTLTADMTVLGTDKKPTKVLHMIHGEQREMLLEQWSGPDPVEGPEYGSWNNTKLLGAIDGKAILHSFAHGKTIYYLRFSPASVLDVLKDTETEMFPDGAPSKVGLAEALKPKARELLTDISRQGIVFPEHGREQEADAIKDAFFRAGMGKREVSKALREADKTGHQPSNMDEGAGDARWLLREGGPECGVFYLGGQNGPRRICNPVWVVGSYAAEDGHGTVVVVEFVDALGAVVTSQLEKKKLIDGRMSDALGELVGAGFHYEPNELGMVGAYLRSSIAETTGRLAEKPGWQFDKNGRPRAYVLPCGDVVTLDDDAKSTTGFLLQRRAPTLPKQRGTAMSWRDEVAALAQDHHLAVFALSAAFSGYLPALLGVEPFGFSLFGGSSGGKTTLAKLMASVSGVAVHSGDMTAAAAENLGVLANDACLVLDEGGAANPADFARTVYTLGNGQGRGRSRADGRNRKSAEFAAVIALFGETPPAQIAAKGGTIWRTGNEQRMFGFSYESVGELGVFNCDAEHPADPALRDKVSATKGHAFSEAFKTAAAGNQGQAGREFVRLLLSECQNSDRRDELRQRLRDHTEWLLGGAPASKELARAADKWALVVLAGELATELKITGWQPLRVSEAVKHCFDAWAELGRDDATGLTASRDILDALDRLRLMLRTRDQMMPLLSPEERNTAYARQFSCRNGYYSTGSGPSAAEPVEFYLSAEGWRSVCGEASPKSVEAFLESRGILNRKASGDKAYCKKKCNGSTVLVRCIDPESVFGSLDGSSDPDHASGVAVQFQRAREAGSFDIISGGRG